MSSAGTFSSWPRLGCVSRFMRSGSHRSSESPSWPKMPSGGRTSMSEHLIKPAPFIESSRTILTLTLVFISPQHVSPCFHLGLISLHAKTSKRNAVSQRTLHWGGGMIEDRFLSSKVVESHLLITRPKSFAQTPMLGMWKGWIDWKVPLGGWDTSLNYK